MFICKPPHKLFRVRLWSCNKISDMSLLAPTGETLMEWHESNASVRKNFSSGRLIVLWALMVTIFGGIAALKFWTGTQKHSPLGMLLVVPIIIILVGFFSSWFSSGSVVCLNELCVVRSTGRYGSRSDYGEIENCTVRTESYNGKKLSVIEFKLKDKSKFRINTPVERVVVPEDINLDQVLQILRDKGIKVVDMPLPS